MTAQQQDRNFALRENYLAVRPGECLAKPGFIFVIARSASADVARRRAGGAVYMSMMLLSPAVS